MALVTFDKTRFKLIWILVVLLVGSVIEGFSNKGPWADPMGHDLYASRVESIPEVLSSMLKAPVEALEIDVSGDFYVTGVGSSEAHARFLVSLINEYTASSASYLPMSRFLDLSDGLKEKLADSTVVVFSQGLSPNSRIVLEQAGLYKQTVLFTAEKPDKYQQYGDIVGVYSPIADESSILVRVIGPMAGYLSAIQFVQTNFPESIIPPIPLKFLSCIDSPECVSLGSFIELVKKGVLIVASSPLHDYGQNLVYKLTEGLFAPDVSLIDYLGFTHGPCQELLNNPRLVIALVTPSSTDRYLVEKLQVVLEETGVKLIVVESKLPMPYSIFEFEAVFNDALGRGLQFYEINQREWLGKGSEAPLYCIRKPLS